LASAEKSHIPLLGSVVEEIWAVSNMSHRMALDPVARWPCRKEALERAGLSVVARERRHALEVL
jgi:hypothetical protein